jgi:hypothetical protein
LATRGSSRSAKQASNSSMGPCGSESHGSHPSQPPPQANSSGKSQMRFPWRPLRPAAPFRAPRVAGFARPTDAKQDALRSLGELSRQGRGLPSAPRAVLGMRMTAPGSCLGFPVCSQRPAPWRREFDPGPFRPLVIDTNRRRLLIRRRRDCFDADACRSAIRALANLLRVTRARAGTARNLGFLPSTSELAPPRCGAISLSVSTVFLKPPNLRPGGTVIEIVLNQMFAAAAIGRGSRFARPSVGSRRRTRGPAPISAYRFFAAIVIARRTIRAAVRFAGEAARSWSSARPRS